MILIACSGTSSSGGSGALASEDGYAQGYCTAYAQCCSKIGKTANSTTCQRDLTSRGSYEQYNPTVGTKCLNEINAAQQKSTLCNLDPNDTPSCDSVYSENGGTGTKQPGEACDSTEDCAPSSEGTSGCQSFFNNNVTTRICQVRIDGKEGDKPCVGTKQGNATISYGSQNEAQPRGYVCDVANGVYCSQTTQTCTKIPDVGEACDTGTQYACVSTAFCDYTAKKCVARLAVGADCTTNSQGCTSDAFCDTTATKKCVAIAADGAPCSSYQQCGTNASCTNGVCKRFNTGAQLSYVCTN
jgi:hypothetical protein